MSTINNLILAKPGKMTFNVQLQLPWQQSHPLMFISADLLLHLKDHPVRDFLFFWKNPISENDKSQNLRIINQQLKKRT